MEETFQMHLCCSSDPRLPPPKKALSSRPSSQTTPYTWPPCRLCQTRQMDKAVCPGAVLKIQFVGATPLHGPPSSTPDVTSQMVLLCGGYVAVIEWTIHGRESVPRVNVSRKW
ncbi:decaprenyl-diphosphate synthase subunit 1 [Platysternon megacephalum]|uniref:Decaprenyl-diphosphate synthase subunit 1 n=1 Tax=Platysternon megacephalum TaxID=55544 RepID=A0A4D9ELM0_9SAUR|nr:decaprenyl-diphosphate synthase subunit 1 [Platysternon megacephalum]